MAAWKNKKTGSVQNGGLFPPDESGDWEEVTGSTGAGDTSVQYDGLGVPFIVKGGLGYTLDGQRYNPAPMTPKQPAGDSSAQVDGQGVPYVIMNGRGYTLDGQPYTPAPLPVNQHPGSSYSSSQSIADPNSLALQRSQLDEQIKQSMQQDARDQERVALQRDVQRVNEEQGNKKLALDASQLAESIQTRIDRNSLDREQMQQQVMLLDRQQAFSAGESALNRQATAGENATNRQFQSAQGENDYNLGVARLQNDRDTAARADATRRSEAAAGFAANGATDFGKLNAFLANGGLSGISTAVGGGQSAITDRSLEPLGALLAPPPTQAPLPAYRGWTEPPPTAVASRSLNATVAAGAPFAGGVGGGVARPVPQPQAQPGAQAQAASGPVDWFPGIDGIQGQQWTPQTYSDSPLAPGVDQNVQTAGGYTWDPDTNATGGAHMQDGGAVVDGEHATINGLLQLARMLGMQPKAVAGERGTASGETVMSNGDVVIVPDKGKRAAQQPRMEFGGGVISDLLERARQYMQNAGTQAIDRFGAGGAPTPVQFSDPGTDPNIQRGAAATTAVARGIPQSSFLNELLRVTPRGMPMGLARRTY